MSTNYECSLAPKLIFACCDVGEIGMSKCETGVNNENIAKAVAQSTSLL